MKRVAAIARLTFAEGVRMRIVLVCLLVLLFLIVRMPFTLRGDETLTGRLQNFLAYSLGALSLLLSVATIFFSCATLTTEIRERSIHLVLTKPVSRFELLLGKWLGINLLNVLIVLVCGAAIYGFAAYIQSRPEQFRRDRLQVRDVVWTARAAARPVEPTEEIAKAVDERIAELLKNGSMDPSQENVKRMELAVAANASWRSVTHDFFQEPRVYRFTGLQRPERNDTVIQIRYKVRATPMTPDELVHLGWQFADPNGVPLHPMVPTAERTGYLHTFLVQAAPIVQNGEVLLFVYNLNDAFYPGKEVGAYFDGDDSLELMYRVGGFEPNFGKALGIIVLKLALLSAIGLFFGAFVSFPVACLCSAAFYLVCIAFPFIFEAIGATDQHLSANVDPYGKFGPAVRALLVPFLQIVFPNFSEYTGTGDLIDGTYIAWAKMGWCALRTLVYGGVLLLVPGWYIFQRREIAQVTV